MAEPYDRARGQLQSHLATLEGLVGTEPFQRVLLHHLQDRARRLDEVLQAEMALIAQDAPHFQQAAQGDLLLAETRSRLTDFRVAEGQALQERQEQLRQDGAVLGGLGLVGVWLACAVFGLFGLRQYQELARSYRTNTELLQEQRNSARRQQLILDAAGDGIYVTDREGAITFANPAVTRLTGYSQPELVGQPAQALLHPGKRNSISAALRTGQVQQGADEVVRRKDGSTFPVEYVSTPYPEGAVVIFRDIGTRLEVERMKEQLLGVVSHELRTPLTAVRGSLELLMEEEFASTLLPDTRNLIEIANENVLRLGKLVDDLVDLERLNAGVAHLDVQPLDARELLLRAEASMRGLAARAGVRLEVEASALDLRGDADSPT